MPNGTLQLVYILNSDTSSTSDIWNRHQKIFGWINTFYNFLFSAILAAAFFFIKCILLSAVIIELEGAEDFPDDDDDDERDDLLLPLLLFPPLFVPKALPEAEERFVKGERRERPKPLVGEGVGRERELPDLLPLAILGIPPPLTPRVPDRVPPPVALTILVCFFQGLGTFGTIPH